MSERGHGKSAEIAAEFYDDATNPDKDKIALLRNGKWHFWVRVDVHCKHRETEQALLRRVLDAHETPIGLLVDAKGQKVSFREWLVGQIKEEE